MEVTIAVDGHAVFVGQDDDQIDGLKVAFNAMVYGGLALFPIAPYADGPAFS